MLLVVHQLVLMSFLVGSDLINLSISALHFNFSDISSALYTFLCLVPNFTGFLWYVRFKVNAKYYCKVVRYIRYSLYVFTEILRRGYWKIKDTI